METPRCSVEINTTPRTSFEFENNLPSQGEVPQVPDISGLTDVTISNSRATSPRIIVNEVMDAMYEIDVKDFT
eukprot:CAMPEP_0201566966 /NCGR_PEP_ID=MMETSP0190_2-20130828/7168_1 /ASSEMBLY_ACC=CAM_ASM_000263 /TAXON_ID=37353 /ORGANISM="Rosalina sp." /LENGTH=72 /DNA_ID=CAMNT_0047986375 /DNA_START=1 /DNA_END=215 /DNA_ORIENTATION=-